MGGTVTRRGPGVMSTAVQTEGRGEVVAWELRASEVDALKAIANYDEQTRPGARDLFFQLCIRAASRLGGADTAKQTGSVRLTDAALYDELSFDDRYAILRVAVPGLFAAAAAEEQAGERGEDAPPEDEQGNA